MFLVIDLKRPQKFLTLLTRGNKTSWLVKGAYVLMAFGGLTTLILASFAGLVLGLGFAAVTRQLSSPFGFGPALALGALVVMFVPDLIHSVLETRLASR